MNKMTIVFLVLIVAFVSYGSMVYAANKVDTTQVKKETVNKTDSLLRTEILAVQAVNDSLRQEISSMKSDLSLIKTICYIAACAIIILLLLIVIAFLQLAKKAGKRRVQENYEKLRDKIEKLKNDVTWSNVQSRSSSSNHSSSQRNNDESAYQPKDVRSVQSKERFNIQKPKDNTPPEKEAKIEEKRHVLKEVYLTNNEDDLFLRSFEQKHDGSNFLIEYDPDDKSNMGDLSVIGNIEALRVMNRESRECSLRVVKSKCTWREATDYSQVHVGQVVKYQDAWKILSPVEITLKK